VADEHSEELQLLVHRALECIRREVHEQTWQAAYAVLMQGDSVADTATKLRMSPNAVYKAKTRVLRRLRETIGLWEIEHRPDDAVENNSQ
jgi:RNA polymerase sigma-70 factor (ECF subfamily)